MSNQYYPSLFINDEHFAETLSQRFQCDGLAVINDVFTEKECDEKVGTIFSYFEKLGTGVDAQKPETWIDTNLPPQTRPGLFQALLSNIPTVWEIRSHANVYKVFATIYSQIRGKAISEFIVSNDGINVRPNGLQDQKEAPSETQDWAHVDQTYSNEVFQCIQGQVVLTNTSACFRATPRSHKIHSRLLKHYGFEGHLGNFLKLDPKDYDMFAKMIEHDTADSKEPQDESQGCCQWQIPILCKKGSMIIWSSSTIHSAKLADRNEHPSETDPWLGGRCTVYVCYRPREEFTDEEIKARSTVVADNRTTNHWATKIFPLKPGPKSYYAKGKKHVLLDKMIADPSLVYQITGLPPNLTEMQKKLAGLSL